MADDDEPFGGAFENGHWEWDENIESLVFVSDLPPPAVEAIIISRKVPTGTIEFRDDIDLIEQLRFRKRYQRKVKCGMPEVVTVQDLKDLAIYTAPTNIMTPTLINILHIATTERFIRALILYCQYYLQVSDEMTERMMEQERKVRTPMCDVIETEFRENLGDLRLLVAKEYGTLLIGGNDTKNFHHMGPQKKRRSLSDKDAQLFEMLIRICVQMVWLALARRSFNTIELEINRILKSDIFNSVEHNLKTGYLSKMTKEEKSALMGHCMQHGRKLNMQSPLMSDVFCHRPMNFRQLGLGVIKYTDLSSRLQYMLLAVAAPEEELSDFGVTVGILGLPRCNFDTMLKPVAHPEAGSAVMDSSNKSTNMSKSTSYRGEESFAKSAADRKPKPIYPDIVLPFKEAADEILPESFPNMPDKPVRCSEKQRRIWQNRLCRLQQQQRKSRTPINPYQ